MRIAAIPLICCSLVGVACSSSSSSDGTTYVTTVRWSPSHEPIVETHAAPTPAHGRVGEASQALDVDPACDWNSDFILSDQRLMSFLGGWVLVGNKLCIKDPGTTTDAQLGSFPYPAGYSWAGRGRAYHAGAQAGWFFSPTSDAGENVPCEQGFTPGQLSDTSECQRIATLIEFDAAGATPQCTPGARRCNGQSVEHCDPDGQWQSESSCSPASFTTCSDAACVPVCAPNGCGTVTVGNVTLQCGGCKRGFTCNSSNYCVHACRTCPKGEMCDQETGECTRF